MKVNEVKYTRRVNTGNYEHEEYTVSAVIEDGEELGHIEAFQQLKADVQTVISGEQSSSEAGQDEAEEQEETKPAKDSKKSSKSRTTTSSKETESGTDEEEMDEEEETDEEDSGDDGETDNEEGNEEEEVEEEKPAKKPAKKTASKDGQKGFKKKPQAYQRTNETMKNLFTKVLNEVTPKWKTSFESKAHAKKVSVKMNGKDFLDAEGKVLAAFKTEVKKQMGKFAK